MLGIQARNKKTKDYGQFSIYLQNHHQDKIITVLMMIL